MLQIKVDLNALINHYIKLPSLFLDFFVLGSSKRNAHAYKSHIPESSSKNHPKRNPKYSHSQDHPLFLIKAFRNYFSFLFYQILDHGFCLT